MRLKISYVILIKKSVYKKQMAILAETSETYETFANTKFGEACLKLSYFLHYKGFPLQKESPIKCRKVWRVIVS